MPAAEGATIVGMLHGGGARGATEDFLRTRVCAAGKI